MWTSGGFELGSALLSGSPGSVLVSSGGGLWPHLGYSPPLLWHTLPCPDTLYPTRPCYSKLGFDIARSGPLCIAPVLQCCALTRPAQLSNAMLHSTVPFWAILILLRPTLPYCPLVCPALQYSILPFPVPPTPAVLWPRNARCPATPCPTQSYALPCSTPPE